MYRVVDLQLWYHAQQYSRGIAQSSSYTSSFSTLCSTSHSFFKPYPFRMTLLPILLVVVAEQYQNQAIAPRRAAPRCLLTCLTAWYSVASKRGSSNQRRASCAAFASFNFDCMLCCTVYYTTILQYLYYVDTTARLAMAMLELQTQNSSCCK